MSIFATLDIIIDAALRSSHVAAHVRPYPSTDGKSIAYTLSYEGFIHRFTLYPKEQALQVIQDVISTEVKAFMFGLKNHKEAKNKAAVFSITFLTQPCNVPGWHDVLVQDGEDAPIVDSFLWCPHNGWVDNESRKYQGKVLAWSPTDKETAIANLIQNLKVKL